MRQRTFQQDVELLVRQLKKEVGEPFQLVLPQHIQERSMEHIVDVPMPQVVKDIVHEPVRTPLIKVHLASVRLGEMA